MAVSRKVGRAFKGVGGSLNLGVWELFWVDRRQV